MGRNVKRSLQINAYLRCRLWGRGSNRVHLIIYMTMDSMNQTEHILTDERLRQAAEEGMDSFISCFTDAYQQRMGGEFTGETMALLNGEQHSLLAYRILHDELMEGGFCQLIQNGYGPYIFHNPLAKVMKLWGVTELGKLLYEARNIYEAHREDLERERTDEEFMAMYEQYEAFDDLEERFLDHEEEFTAQVACYVDDHIDRFLI